MTRLLRYNWSIKRILGVELLLLSACAMFVQLMGVSSTQLYGAISDRASRLSLPVQPQKIQ